MLNDNFSFTGADASISTIKGGGGNNTLTARESANEWHITAENKGVLYKDNAGTGFSNPYLSEFSDIQNLKGSDTKLDVFVMGDTGSIVNIDGGSDSNNSLISKATSGNNTWTLTNKHKGTLKVGQTDKRSGFSNIQTLTGSTDAGVTDTLVGRNQANNWLITGTNTGTVANANTSVGDSVSFSNIENLTGGTGADNFSFTATNASIGIIKGGDGNNTLTARDTDNEWHITAENAGVLYQDDGLDGFGTAYVKSFSEIQNLKGSNSKLDIFEMGLAGTIVSIDGGTGIKDSLVARQGVGNTWDFDTLTDGSLRQHTDPEGVYVENFININDFTGGGKGEWADLSKITGTVNIEVGSYSRFTGVIGSGSNSTLVGKNGANTWEIKFLEDAPTNDGKNDGAVTYSSNGNPSSLLFIGFGGLTGGNGADDFYHY